MKNYNGEKLDSKRCSKCRQIKNILEFYEQKHNSITKKDGTIKWIGSRYEAHCKQCAKQYTKKAYNVRNAFKQFLRNTYKTPIKRSSMTEHERQIRIGFKCIFESPINGLKNCCHCHMFQPLENFRKGNKTCKTCVSHIAKEKYIYVRGPQKHYTPQEKRTRKNEQLKKYFKTYGRILRSLSGDGCCLYCGETNPFMLNNHHIFGRENDDFTITLCEDHHAPFTRGMSFVLEDWYAPKRDKKN